jgi:hypothetical protein
MAWYRRWPLWVCVLTFLVGALVLRYWPANPPPAVPAAGRILTSDGKPVRGVTVQFWPTGHLAQTKTLPFGMTDAKGGFTMIMGIEDGRAKSGAPAANYRVTISTPNPKAPKVPPHYMDPNATPWELSIPPEGKTDILLRINAN